MYVVNLIEIEKSPTGRTSYKGKINFNYINICKYRYAKLISFTWLLYIV